jgi:hypothetical protein
MNTALALLLTLATSQPYVVLGLKIDDTNRDGKGSEFVGAWAIDVDALSKAEAEHIACERCTKSTPSNIRCEVKFVTLRDAKFPCQAIGIALFKRNDDVIRDWEAGWNSPTAKEARIKATELLKENVRGTYWKPLTMVSNCSESKS